MIIELKTKNEITKINSKYSNSNKKHRELNTFMSIMLITKINLDM